MEALAIIGGIVSIAQAGDHLTKLLAKVKNAPLDVQNLINEVADFTGVLNGLLKVLENPEFPTPVSLPTERFCVLQRLVEEAITVLEDLRRLSESFLSPSTGESAKVIQNQKIRRVAWARKSSQVDKSRSRLRDIRLTVLLQLASLQLSSSIKATNNLDECVLMTGQLLAAHVTSQQQLLKLFNEHTALLKRVLQDRKEEIETSPDMEQVEPSSLDSTVGSELQVKTTPFGTESSTLPESTVLALKTMRLRFIQGSTCDWRCTCECHLRRRWTPPFEILRNYVGSISINCSGIRPFIGLPRCNSMNCRRRHAVVNLNYFFPQWLLARVLAISFRFSNPEGPDLLLRTYRLRPSWHPIFSAAMNDDIGKLKCLLATGMGSVLDIDEFGFTSVHRAAQFNALGCLALLLAAGADPHPSDESENTPYISSSDNALGRSETSPSRIRDLFGGDVALKARNFTALHLFVLGISNAWDAQSNLEIIDAVDTEGRTALAWAVHRRDRKNVAMLLGKGANPNTSDRHGLTPLHFAIGYEAYDLVELLVSAGADVNSAMKDGKTPLIQMAQCTRPGTSFSAGSKESTCQDIKNRSLLAKLMIQMLSGGADMELKEEYGRSPLLLAVRWNNHAASGILLDVGADSTVIDFRRWTILHYAASTGDIELLQILARHGSTTLRGVDIGGKSRDGMTATEMAQARDDVGSEWWVTFHELLLSMTRTSRAEEGWKQREEDQEKGDRKEELSDDGEEIFYDAVEHY